MDDLERTLLTKAIDLFAEWARSRWRERRMREETSAGDSEDIMVAKLDEASRDALLSGISQALLSQHEAEIASVVERLEIRRANLQHLEEQRARWGEALVPPIIVNSIRDEEGAVDELAARLGQLLAIVSSHSLPFMVERVEADQDVSPGELPHAN